ncbi:MAG: hypothetical protein R6V85_11830 [Polyangia bacterium]
MRRKPYPHEELVQELREIGVSLNRRRFISDDMDMYYVEKAGYSPIERQMERDGREIDRAKQLARQLVEAGEPAAEAVALGLRMMGIWREKLLPYAERFQYTGAVHEALLLVSRRRRDPIAEEARRIVKGGTKR